MESTLHSAGRTFSQLQKARSSLRVSTIAGLAILSIISSNSAFAQSATAPALGNALGASSAGAALQQGLAGFNSLQRLQDAWKSLGADAGIADALKNRANALTLSGRVSDSLLETTRFQAFYKGLEVVGSSVLHHRSKLGNDVENLLARFDLDIEPTVKFAEALALSRSLLPNQDIKIKPLLKILPADEGSARLVYWVNLEQDQNDLEGSADLLLDAHTGELIARFPHLIHAAELQVYSAARTPQIVNPNTGSPTWVDWSKLEQVVRNGALLNGATTPARKARENARAAESYYRNVHGRDSFDDKGSDIVSVVHYGRQLENAAWNPRLKVMLYGEGDGVATGDFTRALDVAGHEFTHAVTSQAVKSGSTQGLIYMGESGALDEAYADIFGTMISADDTWVMGEELFLSGDGQRKAIRDIVNPGSMNTVFINSSGKPELKPYPKSMSERFVATGTCDSSNDLCWVHVNSTIWSHGAYQVARAIGKAKMEKLYYTTLTHLITPTSSFRRARSATLRACGYLYDKHTCAAVKRALARVGL